MQADTEIVIAVVVATVLLLAMVAIMAFLLVVNSSRRHKHRAEMAEADLRRNLEVQEADREAREQTIGTIGRELHDNVGQLLTVAQKGFLIAVNKDHATDAMSALQESIDEVRRLGRTLNNDVWKTRTLADAIATELERVEKIGPLRAQFERSDTSTDPHIDTKIILYRSFQEVLNNALKHARATAIHVALSGSPTPTLSVLDDGVGFDHNATTNGTGLMNIRNRCALVGYDAILETASAKGCKWTFAPQQNGRSSSLGR